MAVSVMPGAKTRAMLVTVSGEARIFGSMLSTPALAACSHFSEGAKSRSAPVNGP
jgi:hypothetical protein